MNIFSFFENRDETLLPSIIVYYLVFNFITQKQHQPYIRIYYSTVTDFARLRG